MTVKTEEITFNTSGPGDIVDITSEMAQALGRSGLTDGTITAFAPGATTGITTIEYEPGLIKDLPELMEKLIPSDRAYEHDNTWHDGNGFSHLRSALMGSDITVPFVAGKMTLGAWQQIVFLEFDNKARSRTVILQMMGQ